MTWHLYVLRYKYSGNYYVGITPNLTKRMNIHFRRTSENPMRLPQWSRVNRSIQGFKCYWFELLNSHGNTHSSASLVENEVGAIIERKLNSFQNQNIQFYVNWGNKKNHSFQMLSHSIQAFCQIILWLKKLMILFLSFI